MSLHNREKWSSGFGFVMAAAGSAVGLGNIWKFPYIVGNSGGGIFLIFYLLFMLLLGVPILLTEMAIGRRTGLGAVGACRRLHPKWGFAGAFCIIGSLLVLSYYNVVGGWVIKYIVKYAIGGIDSPESYFYEFVSRPVEPIIWLFIFLALSAAVVLGGISKGIERASKLLLPLLFLLLIVVCIKGLTLDGAAEGVKFFFLPDFSGLDSISDWGELFLRAMGQVFFSLSLGMGTLITYGSYLDKSTNLAKSAVMIPAIDSAAALLSGLAVLPAVFSLGMSPTAGPGMLFSTLPAVFARMQGGRIFALLFFILVLAAAITSSISLIEAATTYLTDRFGMSRKKAVIAVSAVIFPLGCLSSLSFGALSDIRIMGSSIFELFGVLSDKLLMPAGGFFLCILTGYIWGIPAAAREISSDGRYPFKMLRAYSFMIKYGAPAFILLIFIASFF